jgi:hypothetical protein
MIENDACAWDDAFEVACRQDPEALLEAQARRAYLAQALDELLAQPIAVYARGNAICVVVFGRIAYINRNGALSVALHDRGVLLEREGVEPAIDDLLVRPTLGGIRQLAQIAIVHQAALALASRRGAPLDLRTCATQDWEQSGDRQDEALLEDAARAVSALAKARWRRIADSVPAALRLDPELRRASRWVGLGQMDALEEYQLLRSADVRPQGLVAGDRTLVAHALSAASAEGRPAVDLASAIHALRSRLAQAGVTAQGWKLLLDSPLGYWKGLHANACYDLELTASALHIGQKLLPPCMPAPALARAARDTCWAQERPDLLRRVPPQVWRTLAAQYATRPKPTADDVTEIVLWASTHGSGMDKSLRAAGYDALLRHAFTHSLMVAAGSEALGRQYVENGTQAVELTTHDSVAHVARIMRNCLESLWPQIEAGDLRVFFGLLHHQRVVFSLERGGYGGDWEVKEVQVRGGGRGTPGVGAFAQRVCDRCN